MENGLLAREHVVLQLVSLGEQRRRRPFALLPGGHRLHVRRQLARATQRIRHLPRRRQPHAEGAHRAVDLLPGIVAGIEEAGNGVAKLQRRLALRIFTRDGARFELQRLRLLALLGGLRAGLECLRLLPPLARLVLAHGDVLPLPGNLVRFIRTAEPRILRKIILRRQGVAHLLAHVRRGLRVIGRHVPHVRD